MQKTVPTQAALGDNAEEKLSYQVEDYSTQGSTPESEQYIY